MTYPKAVIDKAYELAVAQGYDHNRASFEAYLPNVGTRKALCALVALHWPELAVDPLRELAN
jgi:hypothetical protein